MDTLIPLGCYRCDHCEEVSAVYAHSVKCESCADHVCSKCITGDIEDDETGSHGLCTRCAADTDLQMSEEDEAYERAAARARGNDFADTDGKDWT